MYAPMPDHSSLYRPDGTLITEYDEHGSKILPEPDTVISTNRPSSADYARMHTVGPTRHAARLDDRAGTDHK